MEFEPSLLLRLQSSIRAEKTSVTNVLAGRACPYSILGPRVFKLVTGLTYLHQRNRPAAIIFPQRQLFYFFKPCVNFNNQSLKTTNCLAGYPSKGEDKDRLGRATEPRWVKAVGLKLSSIKKNPKDINMVYCNSLEPAELPSRNICGNTRGVWKHHNPVPCCWLFGKALCCSQGYRVLLVLLRACVLT